MTDLHLICRLLLASLLAMPAFAAEWPTLRLCHEVEDLPPYINTQSNDQALTQPGLVLELIERAAEQAQVRLELHRQPWKRCIHAVQQGGSDGLFVVIWEAERDAWARFPGRDPLSQQPVDPDFRLWQVDYSIIVHKGTSLNWDGKKFSGVERGVGAPLGYVVRNRLETLGVLATTPPATDTALRLIALKRLDGFVIEREIALNLIERLQLAEELMLLPLPLMQADWYVPLSHQFYQRHPQVAERFWQALGEQREHLAAALRRRYLSP
jgi:polar amino acid transport system substrate-binding protein